MVPNPIRGLELLPKLVPDGIYPSHHRTATAALFVTLFYNLHTTQNTLINLHRSLNKVRYAKTETLLPHSNPYKSETVKVNVKLKRILVC